VQSPISSSKAAPEGSPLSEGSSARLDAQQPVTLVPTVLPPVAKDDDEDEIDLGQLLALLRRRSRLALTVAALILGLGGLLTMRQRVFNPIYQGSFQLLLTDPISDNVQGAGGSEGAGLQSLAVRGAGQVKTGVLVQVLRSQLLLQPLAEQLSLDAGAIAARLNLANSDKDNPGVLTVSLQWPDPEQGRQVLEALAREYLSYSLRQRQERLKQGLAFLDQQAPELQRSVNQIEAELAAFRRANSFLDPASKAEQIDEQRSGLQASEQQLLQKRAQLQNLSAAVRAGRLLGQQFDTQELVTDVAPQLRGELDGVEQELAQVQATYRSDSPLVANLRARRDQLRRMLQQRELDVLATQLSDNEAQLRAVQGQQARLTAGFARNPDLIRQYDAIQQRLEVAKGNLAGYIQARENFRLEVAQRTVPWQVLSPPGFGGNPVKPQLGRSLLLWALLGTVGGLAAAVIRDRLDHVFHSSRELEDELRLPLLGVIPHLPVGHGQTIAQALAELSPERRFGVRESLRNLFASFRLLRAGKPLRLLLISSTGQAEGKTTAASLYAQTLADLGQKVLLVDADMRRPRVHRYMGLDNVAGISTLLTVPEEPTAELVQDLIQPAGEGLAVLPAGDSPPDAAKLLSSERCRALCQVIRALPGYDVVLFDSPPALELADPVLLSEHLDGLVFLVGIQRVDRALPEQALRRIRASGVDVLGVVANYVQAPAGYGSRYRGYGYGGYGYGGYGSRYGGYGGYAGYGYGYNRYLPASDEAATPASGASQAKRRLAKASRRLMGWLDRRG
jgi:polysaccharide biosynthesis transport protein